MDCWTNCSPTGPGSVPVADAVVLDTSASLTEVEYITAQEEGADSARQGLADLNALPVQWRHSDAALCHAAATLKAAHKISFADAFVAATAKRFDATLVHKDPEFHSLAGEVKQHTLPPKSHRS